MFIHLFHGTSYNRYMDIARNGFSSCKSTIWDCSDEEMTYFYEMERLCESECMEDEDEDMKINLCLERANESAQITSAVEKGSKDATAVFELIVEDSIIEDYMEPDDSCENMVDAGAVEIPSKILNELIDTGVIRVKVHFFAFNPRLSLFYLIGIYESNYFQETFKKLPYEEQRIIKELAKQGMFIDDLYYTEKIKTESWN